LKKKIIFNFVIFVATKKGRAKKFFPSSFVAILLYPRFWIREKSGSGIWDKHPRSATLKFFPLETTSKNQKT
jgi:hypothetical protein